MNDQCLLTINRYISSIFTTLSSKKSKESLICLIQEKLLIKYN